MFCVYIFLSKTQDSRLRDAVYFVVIKVNWLNSSLLSCCGIAFDLGPRYWQVDCEFVDLTAVQEQEECF